MKTIKQIADELNVDKQKVYRYVKKHGIKEVQQECINEALQKNNVKYYDEVAESLIKQGFKDSDVEEEVYHESHQKHINDTVNDVLLKQIEILQNELEIKNSQIEELQKTNLELSNKLIDVSSRVADTLNTLSQSQLADKMIEGKKMIDQDTQKKWWQFWR